MCRCRCICGMKYILLWDNSSWNWANDKVELRQWTLILPEKLTQKVTLEWQNEQFCSLLLLKRDRCTISNCPFFLSFQRWVRHLLKMIMLSHWNLLTFHYDAFVWFLSLDLAFLFFQTMAWFSFPTWKQLNVYRIDISIAWNFSSVKWHIISGSSSNFCYGSHQRNIRRKEKDMTCLFT